MNGRPLAIPRRMPRSWAIQTRRLAELRLRASRDAITRSARLLARHHLDDVRGLANARLPRRP